MVKGKKKEEKEVSSLPEPLVCTEGVSGRGSFQISSGSAKTPASTHKDSAVLSEPAGIRGA